MIEENPSECPSEETLAEFAAGTLPEAAGAVEEHLDTCADCALLVGQLIGGQPESGGQSAREAPEVRASEASRYLLYDVVGTGGMGTVYEAESVHLGRRVALKLLREDPPRPGARERFLREARITAMLEHPNIVPVLEVGELEDGAPYCALRLVRGGTLGTALAACKDLSARLALLTHFRDLCNAIGFAHGRGVIHRDIKPGNVLVGSFGETVVVDWGLARQAGAKLEPLDKSPPVAPGFTRAGAALGTPGYMSPEQAAGRIEEVDERSDVYSLGAVLFELLMGRPPFSGSSEEEMLRRVIVEPPPRANAPGVPRELAAVAAKALSRDRAHRYPNGSAMEADIAAWMTGRRVTAYQYSSWQLMGRVATRHRAIIVGLLMSLALGGAWAGSAWGREHERRHQRAEELIELALRYTALAQWDRAATYFALASTNEDRPEARWGRAVIGDTGLIPLYKLKRHGSQVRSVAFSPDGVLLASVSDDRALRISNVATGAQRMELAPSDTPSLVAFASNSEVLVAAGSALELFDLTGRALAWRQTFPVKVRALAVDPAHGKMAAAAGEELTLWDRSGQAPLARTRATAPIDTIAFLPSGAVVFGGSGFAGLRRWEPPAEPVSVGADGGLRIAHLASCDGPRLAALDSLGRSHLLEPGGTEPFDQILDQISGACQDVSLSKDCRTVACVGGLGSVFLWDTGMRERFASVAGSARQAYCSAFSPDSNSLVVGSSDHAVRLWSLGQSRAHIGARGAGAKPAALAWSPDGARLVSGDHDGTLQLWNGESGAPGRAFFGHRGGALAVAFAPDGTWASAGADGVRFWSADGQPLARPITDPTAALAWSPAGALAAGGADGALRLVAPGGEKITLPAHQSELLALAWSPDGTRLASGGADGLVLLWDALDRKIIARIAAHESEVRTLAFSPDNRWLVSSGADRSIHLWHARDGAAGEEMGSNHTGEVQKIAFVPLAAGAPAAGFLLSVSLPSSIQLWDPQTAAQMMEFMFPYVEMSSIAVSPDGRRAALLLSDGVLSMFPLTGVEKTTSPARELDHLLHFYKYELAGEQFGRDEQALRPPSDRNDGTH